MVDRPKLEPLQFLSMGREFLDHIARFRAANGYGDPGRDGDQDAQDFDDKVIHFYKLAVARVFWIRLMKLLGRRGVLTEAMGNVGRHKSLMSIDDVSKSTASRWSQFARPTFPLRRPRQDWRVSRKPLEPLLHGFTVPFAILGLSPAELGITDGWVVSKIAIMETMTRIRNEILGHDQNYPLDRGKSGYMLDPAAFRRLIRLIRDEDCVRLLTAITGRSDPDSRLIGLWFLPFALICSVSNSLDDYITGFSFDGNEN